MGYRMDFEVDVYIDLEINTEVVTQELMDNYERYFYALSDDCDFDGFKTQIEKHTAHIARCLLRGETESIEGYGKIKDIVVNYDIDTSTIRHDIMNT